VVAAFGLVCWGRQAAILTPSAILFRPAFGRPLEIPLAGIKYVTKIERPVEGGWMEIYRLELLVGGFFDIPCKYIGQDDLIIRVKQLVQPS
jgi:hypothetical protein